MVELTIENIRAACHAGDSSYDEDILHMMLDRSCADMDAFHYLKGVYTQDLISRLVPFCTIKSEKDKAGRDNLFVVSAEGNDTHYIMMQSPEVDRQWAELLWMFMETTIQNVQPNLSYSGPRSDNWKYCLGNVAYYMQMYEDNMRKEQYQLAQKNVSNLLILSGYDASSFSQISEDIRKDLYASVFLEGVLTQHALLVWVSELDYEPGPEEESIIHSLLEADSV